MEMNMLRFINPVEGDVLMTEVDGEDVGGRLKTTVTIDAPQSGAVTVNGVTASISGGHYKAEIFLDGYRNRIEAIDASGNKQAITVFWFARANRKYRFTVDDLIIALQDLTVNKDKYKSIFENPFLKIFKEAHDKYGSLVHINVFYENPDGSFNLSMVTDKFRKEFIANSDWMTFTFHAQREFPDAPYRNAPYQQMIEDCRRVTREIKRFAGKEVLRDTTTLHFATANLYGTRALRTFGFKALCGYFCRDDKGNPIISYYLDKDQQDRRDFWVDTAEGIIFVKEGIVLNAPEWTADKVAPFLDEIGARKQGKGFIQMVIHEQYFYPDYVNYEPDYAERILKMAEWMKKHGYESASLSEIIREDVPGVSARDED